MSTIIVNKEQFGDVEMFDIQAVLNCNNDDCRDCDRETIN